MKKFFNFMLAMLAVCGVACTSNDGTTWKSDNKFTISVTNISDTGATISVAPSNSDTYYFDIMSKSTLSDYSNKMDLAQTVVAGIKKECESGNVELSQYLSSGADSYTLNSLTSNTEYCVYAFGLSSIGEITTDVTVSIFRTTFTGGSSGGGGSTSGDKDFSHFTFGYYANYGDYYDTNAANWCIALYTDDTNEEFVVEVQTSTSATQFTGTYPLSSTFAAGTAVAGGVDDEGYVYGSYWGLLDSEFVEFEDCALLVSGKVEISESNGVYTIKVNAVSENGDNCTLSYVGGLQVYDPESESALSVKSGTVKTGVRPLRKIARQRVVETATSTLTLKLFAK